MVVLERGGNAGEHVGKRTDPIQLRGAVDCRLRRHRQERMQVWFQILDAVEVCLRQLTAGKFFLSQAVVRFPQAELRQGGRHSKGRLEKHADGLDEITGTLGGGGQQVIAGHSVAADHLVRADDVL